MNILERIAIEAEFIESAACFVYFVARAGDNPDHKLPPHTAISICRAARFDVANVGAQSVDVLRNKIAFYKEEVENYA